MMNENLPQQKETFNRLLRLFFPHIYDIKSFQHEFTDIYEGGGLNKIADILEI